ncbi:hypothetical protein SEUCBS139899_010209 [Sporothrix eucalyptigena]|uniref:Uncharacterized protein n=1 Tax=Sporothrix eucalyptigena TaxID=1812306 RepID=A0ABP0CCH6_9PEZI
MEQANTPSLLPESILQTFHDDRAQSLVDLVEQNHATYGLLYNKVLHNHTQHILLASYQLGSSADDLKRLYDVECKDLVPWSDRASGRIVTESDLAEHLGDLAYERDFVDYFAKEPDWHGGWQQALAYHLWESPTPLLISLVGGFGHPLLLLADAVELGSGTLAMDALALAAVDYSGLSELLEISKEVPVDGSFLLTALIEAIRTDHVFDGVVRKIGIQEVRSVVTDNGARLAVVSYLARLQQHHVDAGADALLTQFVDLALDLLAATSMPRGPAAFDFYLNHILSFCNCVRILLPALSSVKGGAHKASLTLFRMLWLMTIIPYITQHRPIITPNLINEANASITMTWEEIRRAIVAKSSDEGDVRTSDPHFVKLIQVLSSFPEYWPALEDKSLRVANKAMGEFHGWRGFGAPNEAPLNTK